MDYRNDIIINFQSRKSFDTFKYSIYSFSYLSWNKGWLGWDDCVGAGQVQHAPATAAWLNVPAAAV